MFDQVEKLQAELIEANTKLFEAGKFAGKQQLEIERLGRQITLALSELEQAHQAIHQVDPMKTLQHIARAMTALAQEDT